MQQYYGENVRLRICLYETVGDYKFIDIIFYVYQFKKTF